MVVGNTACVFITPAFDLLRELLGAEEGQSAYREMADGFQARRLVRACRISSTRELDIACRVLQPNGEDEHGLALALCQLVATQGEALVYVQAQPYKREKTHWSDLCVGTESEVLGAATARRLPIARLREMAPLYS